MLFISKYFIAEVGHDNAFHWLYLIVDPCSSRTAQWGRGRICTSWSSSIWTHATTLWSVCKQTLCQYGPTCFIFQNILADISRTFTSLSQQCRWTCAHPHYLSWYNYKSCRQGRGNGAVTKYEAILQWRKCCWSQRLQVHWRLDQSTN